MHLSETILSPKLSSPEGNERFVLCGEEFTTLFVAYLKKAGIIDDENAGSSEIIFADLLQRVKQEPSIYVAMKRMLLVIKNETEKLMVTAPREKLGKVQFDLFVPFSTVKFFNTEADAVAKKLYENIVLVVKEYERYSHLSEAEIQTFQTLTQAAQSEKRKPLPEQDSKLVIAHYQYLQDKFKERADQEYLRSLHKVHWFSNPKSLSEFVKSLQAASPGEQWELSTVGYDNSEQQQCMWGMGIGIELQGETIWAANSDSRSDNRFAQYPHRKFSYGDAQGMILGANSYLHAEERIHEALTGPSHNELIIRNWQPVAFIVDAAAFNKELRRRSSRPDDEQDEFEEIYAAAVANLQLVAQQLQISIKYI